MYSEGNGCDEKKTSQKKSRQINIVCDVSTSSHEHDEYDEEHY